MNINYEISFVKPLFCQPPSPLFFPFHHHIYITPILKFLYLLPVSNRINFKLCCITHRALSLHEPHYLIVLCSVFDQILILFVLPF